jgi:hypothetical protein
MAKDVNDKSTLDLVDGDKTILSAGAALAAKRKIYNKLCPVCVKEFQGTARAKFCSNKCKQADKNERIRSKTV